MPETERRQFRRLKLRLPITRLAGSSAVASGTTLWTSDISSGGMFFVAAAPESPPEGAQITFELLVPPGEGYSLSAGRVSGSGKIVRSLEIDAGLAGVALRFTEPLALRF
ncbi:MAG: PilZ domain-containing protein [Phycisphaerae bacterium]